MRGVALTQSLAPGDAGVDWPGVVRAFSIGFALTGVPVLLHVASQPAALAVCILMTIVAVRVFEQDAPVYILVANVFSNLFIAFVSPMFSDFTEIEPLKSYSFLTTIFCYATVAYGFLTAGAESVSPFVRRMFYASVVVLAVVGVYFALGLAVNYRNSIIYLRNIGLPILIFQTFLIVGVRHRLPLPQIATVLLGLVLFCCYFELIANDTWMNITNGLAYFTLSLAKRLVNVDEIRLIAAEGKVVTNVMDYGRTALFNTTFTNDLGFLVQRLIGPNFNTISLAYLLAALMAFLLAHGRWGQALLAAPPFIATSAKGPMFLVVGCGLFFVLARRTRRSDFAVQALGALLLVYAVAIFQTGYKAGDYHVLGLIGGVNGFLSWPIGHTLGDGGNLSIPDFSKLDWGAFQRAGSASFAVESAFGVLLYQLGFAAAAVLAFYLWIAATSWRLYRATGAPAMAFATGAILICLVNGLFQEDAYFVPLSLPVVMGLAGLSLGAVDRVLAPIASARAMRDREARGSHAAFSPSGARA